MVVTQDHATWVFSSKKLRIDINGCPFPLNMLFIGVEWY
jgi:hypothetical protein